MFGRRYGSPRMHQELQAFGLLVREAPGRAAHARGRHQGKEHARKYRVDDSIGACPTSRS